MEKRSRISLVSIACIAFLIVTLGCAGLKPAPEKMAPIKVSVDSVDRLNAIAAKPPYQPTDVIVFRINFKLSNPNNVLAKVDDLYFEAKVDDGTPEKMIVLAGSMPSMVIQASGEMMWSYTEPLLFGGVIGQIITRGVGGAEGMKGAVQKRDELWQNLGADKMQFFIEGNITSSLPDFPNLGIVRTQFKTEFAIPKL